MQALPRRWHARGVSGSIGRYRVMGEAGRGGMGAVFRAVDPQGAPVAIKLLRAGPQASLQQRRRLMREAEALLRVRHPGVVSLLGVGEHEATPYLVLEWIQGETLEERVTRGGPLAPREAAQLCERMARALAHCHGRQILHRDLKPSNVLLRAEDGAPLLTDFGLATDVLAGPSSLSATGGCMGTPGYWPPEQALGRREAVGTASDLYGLGALLYFCLTGQPPQQVTTLAELLASIQRPPSPPGALRPGVPAALDALCLRCLAHEPGDRPPDAEAVAGELRAWLERGAGRRVSPRAAALLVGLLGAAALLAALLLVTPPAPRAEGPAVAAPPASAEPTQAPPAAEPPPPAASLTGPELDRELRRLVDAEDYPAALRLVEAALAGRPDDAGLLGRGAACRLALGDGQGAVAWCTRALELDPADGGDWFTRAQAWQMLGDHARAIEDATRAMDLLGEQQHGPRLTRMVSRWRLGDLAGAAQDAEALLPLLPTRATVWLVRADVRRQQGDTAGAAQDAEKAVQLAPDYALARVVRAEVRRRQGDLQGALSDLDQAAAHEPDNASVWTIRAHVRRERGENHEAVRDATKALRLAPRDAGAWALRADARRETGDLDGALQDAERALALLPFDPGAWTTRAEVRRARGELNEALEDAQRGVELDPRWAQGYLCRGRVRQDLRDRDGALEDLRQAQRLAEPGSAVASEVAAALRALLDREAKGADGAAPPR